ncbi:902_t:CDS:2 [Ambispora gerdemannii]|uniref:902_t:CDS:1 n=1 Tax=Ambispora gerdemannii TaxID=144530 RepID=A0A9N9B5Y6_9GLOM|nr:902_t:CDS:2 [Ambispora gerdemannii]
MEPNTQTRQTSNINEKNYSKVDKQWDNSSDLDFDSQQHIIRRKPAEVYETPLYSNNNTSINTTSNTEFPLSNQQQDPQESTSSFSYSSSSSPDWDLESICSTASSHSTIKDDNNNEEYYYQNEALSQNSYTTITSDSTTTTPTQASSQFQSQKSRYIFFAGQIIAPGFTLFSRVTQKSDNNDTDSISQKKNCKSISKRKSVYPVRSPDKVEDGTGVYATCCVYEIFQNEPLKLLDRVKKPTLSLSIAKRLKSRSGMKKKRDINTVMEIFGLNTEIAIDVLSAETFYLPALERMSTFFDKKARLFNKNNKTLFDSMPKKLLRRRLIYLTHEEFKKNSTQK